MQIFHQSAVIGANPSVPIFTPNGQRHTSHEIIDKYNQQQKEQNKQSVGSLLVRRPINSWTIYTKHNQMDYNKNGEIRTFHTNKRKQHK